MLDGPCSHTVNNAELVGSAAGIAAADFRCRRGVAGEVCVACASLRVPMSAGLSVFMPVCWHCHCQGCLFYWYVGGSGQWRWAVGSGEQSSGRCICMCGPVRLPWMR